MFIKIKTEFSRTYAYYTQTTSEQNKHAFIHNIMVTGNQNFT
ncbi:hypothetical protein H312_02791 [Anncaliia algerae PRA339]|uniref:Uncharacterized protein n=1 Tax=Anncaliia algerae PRA339 TaxID=1288291 RepID=A0A059EYH9_9MICR|nr:hypothetical protein H312_02791 [Anncaliia algerae PRA339]